MGDLSLTPGLERSPEGGDDNPLYSCLENHHGQMSLAGNSSWGCKESDKTEQLSTIQQIFCTKSDGQVNLGTVFIQYTSLDGP